MIYDQDAFKGYRKDLKNSLVGSDNTGQKITPKVRRLIELHQHRIDDGVTRGIQNARAYRAIDIAYDVSQTQINPTLMRGLLDTNPGPEQVQNLAKAWGLDRMFTHYDDMSLAPGMAGKGAEGKPGYAMNMPSFITIQLPLLLAYLKARWAKLFNDRDLFPLYKYEPLVQNIAERAGMKVVTSRIQRMASEMNYRAVERESMHKMLLYGQAINFPMEAWYTEKQRSSEKPKSGQIIKEGVRFCIPHPTRVGYDMDHPLYTLNSDTGTSWLFYWGMARYGDLIQESQYWLPKNKKGEIQEILIPTGWRGGNEFENILQQFYPCTIKFPAMSLAVESPNNREKKSFRYNADTLDMGIDRTVFFHKLVPKDWDLYDYEYPVWHRFTYAGNQQVLHCEPLFYCPGVAYLYDYDNERARNSSLGFELMPFQDHLGNLVSQYILTVKKNLTRIIAVNSDLVGDDFTKKMANFSENTYRGFEFFFYSGQRAKDQQIEVKNLFEPIVLQQANSNEVLQAITSLINILERLLGYSAQEVGASASHQQSKGEVEILQSNSGTKIQFTDGFIGDAIYARKKLLYYAMLNYSSDEIFAEVTDMTPGGIKALEDMGFKVTPNDENPGIVTVKGSKKSLVFESLISERDGPARSNDQQTAVMLTTFLDRLMANPRVGQELPLSYIFKFFNSVSEYLGLPTELKLPEDVDTRTAQEKQQAVQQLQAQVEQIVQAVAGPPMEQISQKVGQNAQEVEQAATALAQQQQQQAQEIQQLAQQQQAGTLALRKVMEQMDRLIQMAGTQVGAPPAQPVPMG